MESVNWEWWWCGEEGLDGASDDVFIYHLSREGLTGLTGLVHNYL